MARVQLHEFQDLAKGTPRRPDPAGFDRKAFAGRFAGNHGDAHDTAGSHRMMPRRETARKSRIG